MSKNSKQIQKMVLISVLIALEVVMAFTPIGFIKIPPISITLMHIPVMIGAVLLGPLAGGVLGFVFGLTSMLNAMFLSANPADIIFSPFASGQPISSILMCYLPRILLGVIVGWLFIWLKKLLKNEILSIAISAAIGSLCHTLGVLGLMALLFRSFPLYQVFIIAFGINCLIELAVGVFLSTVVSKPLLKFLSLQKQR